MMKPNIKLYVGTGIFVCSLLTASCKKTESSEFTDTPIIEAYLEPGSYFKVKVTRQIPFSEGVQYSSDDVNNLKITVHTGSLSHLLTPLGEGLYVDSSIIVAAGESYDISFAFNSKTVTAYTHIPTKPEGLKQSASKIYIERISGTSGGFPGGGVTMPDPIEINWTNSDGSYYLVLVENIESTLDPIRDFGDNAPPGNRFRKSPTSLAAEEIRPLEFQYYGWHRVVLYHVLPDYATLYEDNSTSSQNLSNPSTSIANGYGIFTGLNSDTMYVQVLEQ